MRSPTHCEQIEKYVLVHIVCADCIALEQFDIIVALRRCYRRFDRISMDLRQLRYFAQIAESGNVSRAAEVLRIAQPSLSQQMRNLEEELGIELLFRHARGVTPTELGLKFYEHARRILQEV